MYFEEFNVGDVFELNSAIIDKAKMIEFAKDYDPQRIHMDEEYGRNSRFGEIIAPGIMTYMSVWAELAKTDILGNEFLSSQSFTVNWLKPVFAGDVLTGKIHIRSVTPRNPYNGVVELNILIYNQDDVLVMDTTTHAVLARKNKG